MSAILNSSNGHNIFIFQPILMPLVSKSMVYRALSDKTYLLLGLWSPLILRTQLGFLAKNQFPSRASGSIKIPKLSHLCRENDNFNRMLCPVRAVKIYLNKTESIRKHRKRLFIPTQGDQDLKKSTLSRWVKYAIKHA